MIFIWKGSLAGCITETEGLLLPQMKGKIKAIVAISKCGCDSFSVQDPNFRGEVLIVEDLVQTQNRVILKQKILTHERAMLDSFTRIKGELK